MVLYYKVMLILVTTSINYVNTYTPYYSKLLLTVYYSSSCPESKSFVLSQLQPAVSMLHEHVALRLIPFGKAQSLDYGFGGFECQRGQAECFGNMLQDCALNYLRGRTDVDIMAYVACEMDIEAGSRGSYECVEKANLELELVQHCIEYGKGTILQLDSEYYTSLVEPRFIPTVTIGGTFNQQIQDFSQIDLVGTLCSFLKEKPPCAKYYNNIALNLLLDNDLDSTFTVDDEYVR